MAQVFRPVLLAAAIALISGCAAPRPSPLTGTVWAMVSIDGDPPAAPGAARLRFEENRVAASVGCNGLGGAWRLEHDRLIAGPFATTDRTCEGPLSNQEEAVKALLAAAPLVKLEGTRLRLDSGGHSLDLARKG